MKVDFSLVHVADMRSTVDICISPLSTSNNKNVTCVMKLLFLKQTGGILPHRAFSPTLPYACFGHIGKKANLNHLLTSEKYVTYQSVFTCTLL